MKPVSVVALTVFITAAFGLAACQGPPEKKFPLITWTHMDAITFNLGALEINTAAPQKIDPPYVGYLFPVSPLDAAQSWGQQRLAVKGDQGLLRYTILEATATETALEVDQSFEGYFTDEQSERYDMTIVVELTIINEKKVDRGKGVLAQLRAHAKQSRTVPEGIKLIEREQVWFEMVEAAMKDLNTHLEKKYAANSKNICCKNSQKWPASS